jgi:Fur family ferric uptake transcriptional regulator
MPHAPDRPPLEVTSPDDAIVAMRAAGHRVSASTRTVLDALFGAGDGVSAEAIAAHGPDLTSVYRNLERLQALGIVTHVHAGHGPGLYALAREGREYLVCESCHRLTAVDGAELEPIHDFLLSRYGHQARFSHFPIHGYCRACAPGS